MCVCVCVPYTSFPSSQSLHDRQNLPISSKSEAIISATQSHQVVIVRGSTGCGKTTQVPQYILDHMIATGYGAHCNIVITQVSSQTRNWTLFHKMQYIVECLTNVMFGMVKVFCL